MAREFLRNLILAKLNENKGGVPPVVAQNLDHSVISNTLGLGLWLQDTSDYLFLGPSFTEKPKKGFNSTKPSRNTADVGDCR